MSNKDDGHSNRFRGVLTADDREFLNNAKDYQGESQARDARYRIRKRVIQSFKDFTFINSRLSDEDIMKIAENLYEGGPNHFFSAIQLLYSMNEGIVEEIDSEQTEVESFEDLIESGIQEKEYYDGYLSEVTVDITVDRSQPAVDELIEQALEDKITIDEFRYIRYERKYGDLLNKIVEEGEIAEVSIPDGPNHEITPNRAERTLSEMEDQIKE